jgi:hypothetical protein
MTDPINAAQVADRIVTAMERIAETHGPAAAEAVALAVQMGAAGNLLVNAAGLLGGVAAARFARKHARDQFAKGIAADSEHIFACAMLWMLCAASSGFAVIAGFHLLRPVVWAAALGRPEVLIAQRALESAGLL